MLGGGDHGGPGRRGGGRLRHDDALDGGQDVAADVLVEAADVDLQQRIVRDDVGLAPGLQSADGDDGGLSGGGLARHDGLQAQDGGGGHDDGVDGGLGHRAVGAAAEQPHLEAVGGGLGGAGAVADPAGRGGHDVLAEDHVGLREAVEEAVVDHGLRALGGLLGGLEDGEHGALPGVRARARRLAAPASQVTCMSWPQACMTGDLGGRRRPWR